MDSLRDLPKDTEISREQDGVRVTVSKRDGSLSVKAQTIPTAVMTYNEETTADHVSETRSRESEHREPVMTTITGMYADVAKWLSTSVILIILIKALYGKKRK